MATKLADPDYEKWIQAFALYDREFTKWEKRTANILKIYRRETNGIVRNTPAKFNILWSNVQTLVPAVFAKLPTADVARRFKDNDPAGRVASEVLERAINYELNNYPDYRTTLRSNIYDRFLGGRGTCWARYEPHFHSIPMPQDPLAMLLPAHGLEVTGDTDDPEMVEVLKYECAPVDYVHWRDWGCTVARTWEEVTAVWRKVYMTRDAMIERFGEEVGKKIPLDSKPPDLRTNRPYGSDSMDARGLIYEVWDRESQKAIWLNKSTNKILDEVDDPLGLPDFFPCPKPLHATMTTDSIVPIPDYVLYEDQARSLDTLADRISGLIEALKVRGVYDASVPELARLFSEGENNALIPVNNWMAFSEKNGLKGAIDLVDITMLGQALEQAYGAFEQVKQQIYEIIGLADIMRAVSDPQETLGAQQLKANFGGNRLSEYQGQVAQYATDIIRIKAHIICTKYSAETILKIGDADQLSQEDQQLIPQALEILKDDPLRTFRIDIEADSMIEINEEQDKQSRMEFLGAMGGFLDKALAGSSQNPQMAPLMASMVEFGCRGFKVGKTMEGELENAMKAMQAKSTQPPPPPPEMMKIQAESQSRQQELQQQGQLQSSQMQQEAQFKQQEIQLEVWKAQQEQQAQERDTAAQMQLEERRNAQQAQHEQQLELLRMNNDRQIEGLKNQLAMMEALIKERTAIQVAEIAKAAVETPQQEAAAQQGAQLQSLLGGIAQSQEALAAKVDELSAPVEKEVVRDQTGRISHVVEKRRGRPPKARAVVRDEAGRVSGLADGN